MQAIELIVRNEAYGASRVEGEGGACCAECNELVSWVEIQPGCLGQLLRRRNGIAIEPWNNGQNGKEERTRQGASGDAECKSSFLVVQSEIPDQSHGQQDDQRANIGARTKVELGGEWELFYHLPGKLAEQGWRACKPDREEIPNACQKVN